jgi:hypothetical protein
MKGEQGARGEKIAGSLDPAFWKKERANREKKPVCGMKLMTFDSSSRRDQCLSLDKPFFRSFGQGHVNHAKRKCQSNQIK